MKRRADILRPISLFMRYNIRSLTGVLSYLAGDELITDIRYFQERNVRMNRLVEIDPTSVYIFL